MPRSSSVTSKRSTSLRDELERAAADLLHVSESDYPLHFFSLPAMSDHPLTAEGFVQLLGVSWQFIEEHGVPMGELVEERPLKGFFPSTRDLAESSGASVTDPEVVSESKRWRALEALLRKRLRGVRVFRVGTVEIRCYIAGLDDRDAISGLVTTAIET